MCTNNPSFSELFPHQIRSYIKRHDFDNKVALEQFLDSGEDLYSRQNVWGHFTGSAWIVSRDFTKVLLILHGKYNIWVSPGGHVDPGESPYEAAVRETQEEVGLVCSPLINAIFDIGVHRIPFSAKRDEPEHWHADVRYFVFADEHATLKLNEDECNGIRWVPISELLDSDDADLNRMAKATLEMQKLLTEDVIVIRE
ncbi:NUDIX hydrolase [Pseudomonas viridiflava]|uniref:NUDIX hydrolase n=1 Tax=Pseudomonas viridiflava TaxID=33069 RepID=UPI0018E65461|nr:NUDIX hydrolase [Pseudomonas viridiflava]MBI6724716.1 NUDIX hydrolase [Pseudomonas viridiflava]